MLKLDQLLVVKNLHQLYMVHESMHQLTMSKLYELHELDQLPMDKDNQTVYKSKQAMNDQLAV